MSDTNAETKSELKPEQEAVLEGIFQFSEKGDLSEEDTATLAAMFDSPDKFVLLRRAMNILTADERGLTMKNPLQFVEASPSDREKYAFEVAVELRADEKVRGGLISLFRRVHKHIVDAKRAEFEKQNAAEFEEQQRTEEFDEKQEEESRHVGPNL